MPNWKKLVVSGSDAALNSLNVSTNVNSPSFTGSLYGTASWANNSLTASYFSGSVESAISASYAQTASVAIVALTSSFFSGSVQNAVSASYATSASYVKNADSASYVLTAESASFASTASLPLRGIITASVAGSNITFTKGDNTTFSVSIYNSTIDTASYVTSSNVDGPFGKNSILSSSYSVSSSFSQNSISASYAVTASFSDRTIEIDVYVKNVSGAQINKGKVVRISGATGDNPLIATASYENDNNSANTLGITTQNIPNDGFGYIITEGIIYGIDTQNFTAGQIVYLGATGSIIGSPPEAPLHEVRLGEILRVQQNNGSMYVRINNGYELGELHDVADTSTTSSYGDLLVRSGSVWYNSRQLTGSYGITGSLTVISGGFSGSLFGTASWARQAVTASHADSFSVSNNAVVSGSLTILQNLRVFGSASITYVTESTLNISTNLITVNTNTPAVRFGGLAVIDSGSSPALSGSWLFDSEKDRWVFIHQQIGGSIITSSIAIMGPETYNNLGNETQITLNRLTKGYSGISGEHIGDSQVSDDGTTVSIPGNLAVTGSIIGLINSASFAATASYVLNAVSSSFAISASRAISAATASYVLNAVSASFATSASYAVSASFATTASYAVSASQAQNANTASYVLSAVSSSFATSASYAVSASQAQNAVSSSYALSASQAQNAVSSSYPFSISGSTIYSNTGEKAQFSTIDSIIIGTDAGISSSNAFSSNFLGVLAGNNATNANSSNFLGNTAGYQATNADNSNFLGNTAGYQATNANYSNFIGAYAGGSATNANSSNFLGLNTGENATNAYGSNFLGNSAGIYATNANNSNFLGFNAGGSATNASQSNFLGYTAGDGATDANSSNFLGSGAGGVATNANNSNFLGTSAGGFAVSASYSTLIGYQVGYDVGYGETSIKSNNIIIGTNITLGAGRQDSINIGGLIFGTGSYSNISTQSSGSANGRIGINQPLPLFSLDVSGSGRYTNGLTVTGSLNAPIITGSLFGTASWANNAVTASYVLNAVSSSFATTASYVLNSVTSSFSLNAATASNVQGGASNYLALWNGATTLSSSAIYQSSGNVGIANTASSYRLDVSGDTRTLGNLRVGFTGSSNEIRFYGTSGDGPSLYSHTAIMERLWGATDQSELMLFKGNDPDSCANCEDQVRIASAGRLVFHSANTTLDVDSYLAAFPSNRTGSMYVDGNNVFVPNGNLGVGKTSTVARLDVNGNAIVTGSLTVTQGITSSLFGTASWAIQASTASFVSNAISSSFAATASSADNFTVRGTLTAQTIVAQVITSSTDFVTGSTRFGSLLSNTHTFTGSVNIIGSMSVMGGSVGIGTTSPTEKLTLTGGHFYGPGEDYNIRNFKEIFGRVSDSLLHIAGNTSYTGTTLLNYNGGSVRLFYGTTTGTFSVTGDTALGKATPTSRVDISGSTLITGSLSVSEGITGSLFGTASWANNAVTASFISNAVSASFASTASFSNNFTVASQLTIDATLTDYATVASSTLGSNNVFTQATGSYTSAFFKYAASSGSNSRAGEVVATWNGTSVQYYDNSTVDVGTTVAVTSSVSIVGSNVQFNVQTNTSGWRIKSLATFM